MNVIARSAATRAVVLRRLPAVRTVAVRFGHAEHHEEESTTPNMNNPLVARDINALNKILAQLPPADPSKPTLYIPAVFSDTLEWVLETPVRIHEFAESPIIVEATSNNGCDYVNPEV